ncbi:MAG: hypothetical protein Q9208_001848 [Pyrenodesmia sp. 3 TL-2023]
MAQHNALICGAVSYQFFAMAHGADVLEVFVQRGEDADALVEHIESVENYGSPSPWFDDHLGHLAIDVHDVTVTEHAPVRAILCNARTTATANILSWNKAYSIFPSATFIHGKSYLLKPTSIDSEYSDWEYASGMKLQDLLWDEEGINTQPIQRQRRIGDRFSWIIDFPTLGITCKPKVPDFVLEHCNFMLIETVDFSKPSRDDGDDGGSDDSDDDVSWPYGSTGLGWYELKCEPLIAQVLKYQYTHGSHYISPGCRPPKDIREEDDWGWRQVVMQRTSKLTLLELLKIDGSDRPENFRKIFKKYSDAVKRVHRSNHIKLPSIEKPKQWLYVDEDIPKWYRAWEKEYDKPENPTEL